MKYPLLYYCNLYSNLVPLGVGTVGWRRLVDNPSGAVTLFVYIVLGTVTEVIVYWMAIHAYQNLWVLHLYQLMEFILLVLLFSTMQMETTFHANNRFGILFLSPRTMWGTIGAYTAFWLVSKWTFERWNQPSGYTLTISTLVFILLSLSMFYELLKRKGAGGTPLLRTFQFWVTLGVLLYFTGSAVEYLTFPLLVKLPKDTFLNIWSLHWVINIVSNVSYAYAFLCLTSQPQTA